MLLHRPSSVICVGMMGKGEPKLRGEFDEWIIIIIQKKNKSNMNSPSCYEKSSSVLINTFFIKRSSSCGGNKAPCSWHWWFISSSSTGSSWDLNERSFKSFLIQSHFHNSGNYHTAEPNLKYSLSMGLWDVGVNGGEGKGLAGRLWVSVFKCTSMELNWRQYFLKPQ